MNEITFFPPTTCNNLLRMICNENIVSICCVNILFLLLYKQVTPHTHTHTQVEGVSNSVQLNKHVAILIGSFYI